jgi:hypothetical protein
LKADGIVLPEDTPNPRRVWSDTDSGIFSSAEDERQQDDDDDADVAQDWREIHESIKSTIAELGGTVMPKLNWSAPKDATWISATNSMECQTPDDVYLLLKGSDFITHDLEHAFDDTVTVVEDGTETPVIPYHLALRKRFELNPSLEFRCFVRRKRLIAICQRDMNHFDFLFKMQEQLKDTILDFYYDNLKDTFPDENFVFDVYLPPPHRKVWLIDINPWAARTDPLLFSWLELLTMPGGAEEGEAQVSEPEDAASAVEEIERIPIFRLIERDDPEAYSISQQYSAHKLPKDVVDASRGGEVQLREFADQWKELLERSRNEQTEDSETD